MREVSKQIQRIDNFEIRLKGFGKRQKILLIFEDNAYELSGLRAPRKGEIFLAELRTYKTKYTTRYIAKIVGYEEKNNNIFDYTTYLIGVIQTCACLYGLYRGVDILLIIFAVMVYFALYLYNARKLTIGTNILYFVFLVLNIIVLIGIYCIPI